MAEARFIKTVTYGGYDKAEVIRRLEYLNEQVFSLKNELRETKLLLESSKNGKEIQKSIETVLAGERAKLTEVQVQNDTLSTKLKASEDRNRKNEEEIKRLNASLEEVNAKLADANAQLATAQSEDEALALSTVFIEAKKSADMLESSAREKAEQLEKSAAEAAEKSIAYANDEGAVIIHEAECRAAEIIAEAKNAASEMETAYDNMRSSVLSKMTALGEQLGDFKEALMKFEENGVGNLYECEELLKKTEDTLTEGGIPVFREPSKVAPEYPERPKRKADLDSADSQKRRNELDKLRQMAESISGGSDKEKAPEAAPEAAEEAKPSDNDASDNSVTADNSSNNSGNNDSSDRNRPKSGKIDLATLAKQAKALNEK
ncbi:MAG: plectin [Ruminococcus sp.]|nr:plectin [Ruminococcus sp.]